MAHLETRPSISVQTVETKPIQGQKTGTSGLRKRVKEVSGTPNYVQNWVQSLFDSIGPEKLRGVTFVIGGDGRYFNSEAIQIIIRMLAANGVARVIVGQNGLLSTPAGSAVIRKYKAFGGLLLTASHNPGGPDGDWGIKYNTSNGGPAPESITNAIYEFSLKISQYRIADLHGPVDLSHIGTISWEGSHFQVDVIDSVADYLELLKSECFDFAQIRKLTTRSDFRFVFDAMSAVTGIYARRIFVDELGLQVRELDNVNAAASLSTLSTSVLLRCRPLPDFGGHHPDPNLTYAKDLVDLVNDTRGGFDVGAASDGDGDRNMILGRHFFVTPSDSLAVISWKREAIAMFARGGGIRALARSMPTSSAVDAVAAASGVPLFEVPTGWKFFGNIMDHHNRPGSVICGEESFGTGADHIREKDGIWAVLAWLSILANDPRNANGTPGVDAIVGPERIMRELWDTFGRVFYTRWDFECVAEAAAAAMFAELTATARLQALQGATVAVEDGRRVLRVDKADEFEYHDQFDGSVTRKQGVRLLFIDRQATSGEKPVARVMFRLSGTGSVGATIRVYIELVVKDRTLFDVDTQTAVRPLVEFALRESRLREHTGRDEPTVIT